MKGFLMGKGEGLCFREVHKPLKLVADFCVQIGMFNFQVRESIAFSTFSKGTVIQTRGKLPPIQGKWSGASQSEKMGLVICQRQLNFMKMHLLELTDLAKMTTQFWNRSFLPLPPPHLRGNRSLGLSVCPSPPGLQRICWGWWGKTMETCDTSLSTCPLSSLL